MEAVPEEEIDLVDQMLDACVRKECGSEEDESGWSKVVGVMGFSQGARLVPGLMLRQLVLKQEGRESRWDFKFGVIVGGPYCPISMLPEAEERDWKADYKLLKTIPTVHAWGREDHVKSGCIEMMEMCDGDVCFQMDFEGGHHMPLKDVEAKDLCDLVRAAWFASGGVYELGKGEKY